MEKKTLAERVKIVNENLKAAEPKNTTTDHKGYSGYSPQYVIDAVNSQFIGEWSTTVLEHATYPLDKKHAFVKVSVTIMDVTFEAFASHIIQSDPGDAFKSAQTDATKKALSYFSIGNRAYHGLLGKKGLII